MTATQYADKYGAKIYDEVVLFVNGMGPEAAYTATILVRDLIQELCDDMAAKKTKSFVKFWDLVNKKNNKFNQIARILYNRYHVNVLREDGFQRFVAKSFDYLWETFIKEETK